MIADRQRQVPGRAHHRVAVAQDGPAGGAGGPPDGEGIERLTDAGAVRRHRQDLDGERVVAAAEPGLEEVHHRRAKHEVREAVAADGLRDARPLPGTITCPASSRIRRSIRRLPIGSASRTLTRYSMTTPSM